MAETGFLDRVTDGSKWMVYVPPGGGDGLPAIQHLHGIGESGTDGIRQTAIGLGSAIQFGRSRWPFVVVLPQKPTQEELWPRSSDMLDEILLAVEREFEPDPHRRYITGLSQGGHGVFELAPLLRWKFAAAAPVCGWADLDKVADDFSEVPLGAFHGEDDAAVPHERSVEAVQKIKEGGGEAELTLLPEVGHNAWDHAYRESNLPEWFLRHNL